MEIKRVLKIQGNKVTVSEYPADRATAGKKRKLDGFSDRSRLALLDAMNRAVYKTVTMVTLTFHENVQDKQTVMQSMRAWEKRMTRAGYNMSYFWKLERQSRGAIHVHLFCLNPNFSEKVARNTWADVVDGEDVYLRLYGCRVERCIEAGQDDMALVASYVAKYCAKGTTGEGAKIEGRNWGSCRVEYAEERKFEVSPAKFEAIRAIIGSGGGVIGRVGTSSYGRIYGGKMGRDVISGGTIGDILSIIEGDGKGRKASK